jgi:hypothetical protein
MRPGLPACSQEKQDLPVANLTEQIHVTQMNGSARVKQQWPGVLVQALQQVAQLKLKQPPRRPQLLTTVQHLPARRRSVPLALGSSAVWLGPTVAGRAATWACRGLVLLQLRQFGTAR